MIKVLGTEKFKRSVAILTATYIISGNLTIGVASADSISDNLNQTTEVTTEYDEQSLDELLASVDETLATSQAQKEQYEQIQEETAEFSEQIAEAREERYRNNEETKYHLKNQTTTIDLDFSTLSIVGETTWGASIYTIGAVRDCGLSNEEFIEQIAPLCQLAYETYGIPASTIMAQIILETGWGSQILGNNVLGIKASSSYDGPVVKSTTTEYTVDTSDSYQIESLFRGYDSIAECIYDYCQIVLSSDSYSGVITDDWEASVYGLTVYATDPSYFELLISIIQSNNLTQYNI